MAKDYSIVKLGGELRYSGPSSTASMPDGVEVREYQILSHDSSVTQYFGVVLEPAVTVAPEATESIFVNIPADTGIYFSGKGSLKQVDTISRHDKRFALYGAAADGMIYRYVKLKHTKRISRQGAHLIPTNIVMSNKSKEWQLVSKVIFLAKSFDLFSDGSGVCGERVQLNILNEELAVTKLGNSPSVSGARMMPHRPARKKPEIKPDSVTMRYGV